MHAFGSLVLASALLVGCARSGLRSESGEVAAASPTVAPQLDYCTAVYDKTFECASAREKVTIASLRDEAMKACRTRQVRDTLLERAELACTHKPTCEEYFQCQDLLLAEEDAQAIGVALASGEGLADALATCREGGVSEPKLMQPCRELLTRAVALQTRELEAVRDAGGDGRALCLDLYQNAVVLSRDAQTKARTLCEEAEAGRRAQVASDEAREFLAKRALEVPVQCALAVEDLEKLTSDWAKQRLREVLQVCYVELGRVILPAAVPDMLICDFHVERVFEVVQKFGLKDATLDPWIARASKKCTKRVAR